MNPDEASPVEYRSSLRVNWSAFLPWTGLTLSASAGLAYCMDLLFRHGHYYFPIVPMFAALISAGMVILTVHKGHCRNPFVGLVLGLIAASGFYGGFYYAGMISEFGPGMATRPALLPDYIALRKRTELTRHHDLPKEANAFRAQVEIVHFGGAVFAVQKLDQKDILLNWIFFSVELGIAFLVPAGAGYFRARRAYCEGCRRWLTTDQAVFPYALGENIAEMVSSGNLKLLHNIKMISMPQRGAYTSLVLEYCPPGEGRTLSCPAYLSVKDVRFGGGVGLINQFEAAPGRMRLRGRLIDKEQIAELIPVFPKLSALIDKSTAGAYTEREARSAEKSTALVEIWPIQCPFAGNILSKRVLIFCTVLALMILPLFFGSGLVALGGFYLLTDEAKKDGWPAALTDNAVFVVSVGLPLFLVSVYIGLRRPNIFAERYLKRRAKNEIRCRPDSIVDCDDPEAIFVQVVPRSNWGRIMLETATDVGFLKVDETRREILFEGDEERYRIPGSAVVSCDVEEIVYGEGTHGRMRQYTTVLRARSAAGIWENPIGQRGDFGTFGAARRLHLAEELREKILRVSG